MKEYLDPIFNASDEEGVCRSLQISIDKLKARKYMDELPECYKNLTAQSPIDIQDWFDKMKVDRQAEQEGNLREVFGLFGAALQQLRKHGFHRTS